MLETPLGNKKLRAENNIKFFPHPRNKNREASNKLFLKNKRRISKQKKRKKKRFQVNKQTPRHLRVKCAKKKSHLADSERDGKKKSALRAVRRVNSNR